MLKLVCVCFIEYRIDISTTASVSQATNRCLYMCPCSTKAVISNTGIFVAIDNNTLYESKLYILLLCQKSLGY